MDDPHDDLDELIAETELRQPGARQRIEQMTDIVRITTALRQQREALALSVADVAERSGLSLDDVISIEDNAVDAPLDRLARYADAVGMRLSVAVA